MKRMICRNKVKDFEEWKAVFDENLEAARAAGLGLENLWRSIDDPNDVFFIFTIEDLEAAHEFIGSPEAAESGRRSGVLEGDCWIVE